MLTRISLLAAFAALCSGPLAAQTCAGGANGGMDAQGCDCNDADLIVASAATSPAIRPPVQRAADATGKHGGDGARASYAATPRFTAHTVSLRRHRDVARGIDDPAMAP